MAFDYLGAVNALESEKKRCDREWDTCSSGDDQEQIINRQIARQLNMDKKYGISREWRLGVCHIVFAEMK